MSKYVIDTTLDNVKKVIAMGVTKGGAIWTDTTDIENLEELNSDYISEHFGDLQDGAYQRGLDEAWKAARRISVIELNGGLAGKELMKIYGTMDIHKIYDDNTASEAIAKLKAYEEKQKTDEDVKHGDVVRHKINGLTYIVTLANECGYVLLDSDGNFATSCITNSFEKTGKHVDIASILEAMKHEGH